MSNSLSNSDFDENFFFKKINWKKLYKVLIIIQSRIVKHVEKKNFRKVRDLQRLLMKSFAARIIVSQKIIKIKKTKKYSNYIRKKNQLLRNENIIDFINNIDLENIQKYTIPTLNSTFFKLIYLLWVLALLPILETQSWQFSYNYRIFRNHHDFIYQLVKIFTKINANWIFIIKINGFFCCENIDWLFKNLIIEKKFLKLYLKSNIFSTSINQKNIYSNKYFMETKISMNKILQSFSLQAEANHFENHFDPFYFQSGLVKTPIFLYNNLIIIPSKNCNQFTKIQTILRNFYKKRGLIVRKKRSWKIDLNKGFNFLGWNLKKKHKKVILNINHYNIKAHRFEIKRLLALTGTQPIDKVIDKLNEKIIYWQYYYSYASNCHQTWSKMNSYIFWRIWKWCKKRNKNKGSKWIYERYWIKQNTQNWVFSVNNHSLVSYYIRKQKITLLPGSLNVFKLKNYKTVYNIQTKKNFFFNN